MSDHPAAVRLHPLHRLWRMFPPRARRRALLRATWAIAPRPDRSPPPAMHGVAVAGELSRASGLGEGARLMLHGVRHLGLPAWPIDLSVPGARGATDIARPAAKPPAAARPAEDPPPQGAPLVLHVNPPMLPFSMLRLGRAALRDRRIVGYWAWELPVVPHDWRAGLPFVHEVWAPSRFTAGALDSLVPGRVRVVPHPLAVTPPTVEPDRTGFGLPADVVTVLVSFNLASSFERKNPLAAIAAFRAAFANRNDRLLLIKVGHPEHFPADLARLREAVGASPNIRLDLGTLAPCRSRALTASADIVLSLHRSEGFGLIPAEAMLLGKPVIATGWSGNMDYMDATCAAPIGYRLVPVTDPRGIYDIPGGEWAEADLDDAVVQLRRLADDPELRTEIGRRARAAARMRLTVDPLAAALRDLGLPVP